MDEFSGIKFHMVEVGSQEVIAGEVGVRVVRLMLWPKLKEHGFTESLNVFFSVNSRGSDLYWV